MYDTCRYLRAIEHHLISSSIVYAPVSMMATMERKPSPSGSRSSKRSQRASFFPLKLPMVGSTEFSFLGSTKSLFSEAFCGQFQGVFFSCLKPHTLAEEHLFLQHISSAITRRLLVHQFQALPDIFGELFGCSFWEAMKQNGA